MTNFPNKAGNRADNDLVLSAELKAAGIPILSEMENISDPIKKLLLETSGEVKSSVVGVLHGWEFKRAWYYWVCKGPGIEISEAQVLQDNYGKVVRANGDAACRGPLIWFHGLACGSYHVDSPEGLKALADTIKRIVKRSSVDMHKVPA